MRCISLLLVLAGCGAAEAAPSGPGEEQIRWSAQLCTSKQHRDEAQRKVRELEQPRLAVLTDGPSPREQLRAAEASMAEAKKALASKKLRALPCSAFVIRQPGELNLDPRSCGAHICYCPRGRACVPVSVVVDAGAD